MYMNKEILIQKAMDKVKTLAESDFSTMKPRTKAIHSIELEKLYNDLSPLRKGSELAGMVADDCMKMKVKLIESDSKPLDSTKQKRAKVIMQGMNNTQYDIPWLRQ